MLPCSSLSSHQNSKVSLAPPPAMMAQLASDADAKGPYDGRKGVASQFQENYSQKASAYASPSITLPWKSCLSHPPNWEAYFEPSSFFPILWPLNKDCAVSISALTFYWLDEFRWKKNSFWPRYQGLSWTPPRWSPYSQFNNCSIKLSFLSTWGWTYAEKLHCKCFSYHQLEEIALSLELHRCRNHYVCRRER